MSLENIKIINFRHFNEIEVTLEPGYNLIIGNNGSGKTSFLEAIYFLTHGRSFQSTSINRIINTGQHSFTLFGSFSDQENLSIQAGITRYRNGECKIKINSMENSTIVDLVNIQPLLLLNPFTFQLLNSGPQFRRQFIDWGLFHVEHQFIFIWRRMQRALKQRNVALKDKTGYSYAKVWDLEFVTCAKKINELRKSYIEQFIPVFLEILEEISPYKNVTVNYFSGWDENFDLNQVLEKNFERDHFLGYTQAGPQKADIIIKYQNIPVIDLFSRGEQKLLVYALKLAQGLLLKKLINKNSIYLIDDLSSELDEKNQKSLFSSLNRLNTQIILTSINQNPTYLTSNVNNKYYLKDN